MWFGPSCSLSGVYSIRTETKESFQHISSFIVNKRLFVKKKKREGLKVRFVSIPSGSSSLAVKNLRVINIDIKNRKKTHRKIKKTLICVS